MRRAYDRVKKGGDITRKYFDMDFKSLFIVL